jgi:hypothetical protein
MVDHQTKRRNPGWPVSTQLSRSRRHHERQVSGIFTSSRQYPRASAICSVSRPSPGRPPTGEVRRKQPLAGEAKRAFGYKPPPLDRNADAPDERVLEPDRA